MREQKHIGQKSVLVLVRLAAMWTLVTKAAAASVAIVDIGNHGVGSWLHETIQTHRVMRRKLVSPECLRAAETVQEFSRRTQHARVTIVDFVLSLYQNPNKRFMLSLLCCQNSFMGFVEAPSLQEHHHAWSPLLY
jgi:hypothetical protein